MSWTLNTETGELAKPDGTVVATLDGPPYTLPTDAQNWAEQRLRKQAMSELTTDDLADLALLWTGHVERVTE